jgi:hypothetical protein
MGVFSMILAGAAIALIAAWAVNTLVSILSGGESDGVFNNWWGIFSKMWRNPVAYAEPLPDALRPRKFAVGDQVRVQMIPPELERSLPEERREALRRCAGRVLRVEGIDEFGGIELHVLDDGTQSPDRNHHIFFIGPQYLEPADQYI